MTELSDVIPQSEPAPSIRRARVISVSGRTLKVDLGGGIDIPSLDSCNPVPDQWVYIIGEGSSMMAIGAVAGPWRQAAITVTGFTSDAVAGVLNGVPSSVSKAGTYTVAVGNVLPLLWAADGSRAWALGPGGIPYVAPPDGGGGTGGGGGVTSGTATYAATWAGTWYDSGWRSGSVNAGIGGGYFYGSSRFRELQGRTITGFRVNITRSSGGGSIGLFAVPNSGPGSVGSLGPGTTISPGGYRSLPIAMANYLITGSGTGGLMVTGGSGVLSGLPAGTLQFDWRR